MVAESEFQRAILNRPDDSTPRFAYADWLDDQCNPLGEFIRVQHRLERLTDKGEVLFELERRESELLGEFEAEWLGDLAGLVEWCSFRRGFVHEISLSDESFIEHGQQIFELAPVRLVHFSSVTDPERLASCPHLQRVAFADFSDLLLGNRGVRVISQSQYVGDMRGLNFSGVGVANSGAQALARSTSLRRLRELYLSDNRIGDLGGSALARSRILSRLETLCLRFNGIGAGASNILRQRFGDRVKF